MTFAVSTPPPFAPETTGDHQVNQVASFDHDPTQWNHPSGRNGPRLRGGAVTHPGLKRPHNEDNLLLRPDAGVFAVADGLGGHNAGEVASDMALRVLDENCVPRLPVEEIPRALYAVVDHANEAVFQSARRTESMRGMGTTLSAVWFAENRALIAHVGDSRIYRMREGVLQQLTEDHTLQADAIREGIDDAQARMLIPSNIVTRAVGVRARVVPMLASCSAQSGDRFLLCSDGLTDMVSEDLIAQRLALWPQADQAAAALLDDALAGGGVDNVTVLVVDVA
jgi:protein phosphatase